MVYHQGDTVLNSYAWTYSDGGLSPFSGTENGTVPFTSWTPTGGLMPIYDTTGVTEALSSGSLSGSALLTSCTSADGTATYAYDPTGQLIAATYSNPQSLIPNPSESYSYDANGNRVTANGDSYVTGADNQLLSDGTYTYAYDAEGNRTARFVDVDQDGLLDCGDTDISQYAWDARNRLTEVVHYATYAALESQSPDQVVDYLYDAENRWIGESIDSNGDGQIDHQIRFVYDGNQIVLQFEKDVSPLPSGEGQGEGDPLIVSDLSHRYLWQPDAVDQLMADEQLVTLPVEEGGTIADLTRASNVLWALTDHLGTVRDLAKHDSTTGVTAVVNHYVYDSFGNLKSETNAAVDCLFGFTGRPFDTATGLQNNLNRWYDPSVGQWLSKDPIGFEGGDANIRRYVGNSPTCGTDARGLWKIQRGSNLEWGCAGAQIGDTWASLAAKVHLNADEYLKWVRLWTGGKVPSQPVPGTWYSIPNTIVVYEQSHNVPILGTIGSQLKNEVIPMLEAEGFHVVYAYDLSEKGFRKALTTDGIYGFVFVGHGTKNQPGWVNVDTVGDNAVSPINVSTPYKLAMVYMLACGSAQRAEDTASVPLVDKEGHRYVVPPPPPTAGWEDIVSDSGVFFGFSGNVNMINFYWQARYKKHQAPSK